MKVFLTGATGFLGSNIATQLVNAGIEVKAMCRGELPAQTSAAIEYVKADLNDVSSLLKAINNCDAVIHAAAMVKIWNRDQTQFSEVNFHGTKRLLSACETVGVNRFVYVSTAGAIGPTTEIPVTESFKSSIDLSCHYILSKQLAGKEVLLAGRKGMFVNIVYPSRMYGPGPLNHANSITKMMDDFRNGKWYFKPPYGHVTGSYNHVEAVAAGIVNALLKGLPGEQYLLAGDNISYEAFFNALRVVTGSRQKLYSAPYPMLYLFGLLAEQYGKLNNGYIPTLNRAQIKRFQYHYAYDSSKAVRELEYKIVPFEYGLTKTVEWLKSVKN